MAENDDPARQALVLDQRKQLLYSIMQGNDNLDKRMYSILQSGSIIIGFASLVQFSKLSPTNILSALISQDWVDIAKLTPLLIVFVVYFVIAFASIWYLRPINRKASGTTDWEKTFDEYLYSENCFNQILADLHESIDNHLVTNEYKAKGASHMSWLLVAQIFFLILAVALSG